LDHPVGLHEDRLGDAPPLEKFLYKLCAPRSYTATRRIMPCADPSDWVTKVVERPRVVSNAGAQQVIGNAATYDVSASSWFQSRRRTVIG
jgi:hypothetical protein